MLHGKRTIFLATLVLAGITTATSAQTTLRYKFAEGEKLTYVLDQKMKMAMSIMGKDVDSKMNISMEMTWNILKVDRQGNAQLKIKVVHAKMSMDGLAGAIEVDSKEKSDPNDPLGKVFGQVIRAVGNMEMTGSMAPTGEMKDIKVSEETLKALKNLPGADKVGDMFSPENFKSMVNNLVFPADPVSKGKSWTNKVEAKTPFGKTVTDNTYLYEGSVDMDGVTYEKIAVKPAIRIEADPGAPIDIKLKDVKASGKILFDNKAGRLIETSGTQKMEMQITANGLNLNQTVDQVVTLRLKTK